MAWIGPALGGAGQLYSSIFGGGGQQSQGIGSFGQIGLQGLQAAAVGSNVLNNLNVGLASAREGLGNQAKAGQFEIAAAGQLGILDDARQNAAAERTLRGQESLGWLNVGLQTQAGLNNLKLQTEGLGAGVVAQAGLDAALRQNQLASNIADASITSQLKDQDLARTLSQMRGQGELNTQVQRVGAQADVARRQAETEGAIEKTRASTIGDIGRTRAQTEGQVALSQQNTLGRIGEIGASTQGNVALQRAGAQRDLARIKGETEGAVERIERQAQAADWQKKQGFNRALAGASFFS